MTEPSQWGRRTTYKGVEMRSRTEARFAAVLDRLEHEWRYEPMVLACRHGQWLPDFEIIDLAGDMRIFVEVKPTRRQIYDGLPLWERIAWGALPGEKVWIIGAGFDDAVGDTEIIYRRQRGKRRIMNIGFLGPKSETRPMADPA